MNAERREALVWEAPVGAPYQDLKEIVSGKPYFVLTTNIDIQFPKALQEKRICGFQGDFRFAQCGQPCHDKLYEGKIFYISVWKLLGRTGRKVQGISEQPYEPESVVFRIGSWPYDQRIY